MTVGILSASPPATLQCSSAGAPLTPLAATVTASAGPHTHVSVSLSLIPRSASDWRWHRRSISSRSRLTSSSPNVTASRAFCLAASSRRPNSKSRFRGWEASLWWWSFRRITKPEIVIYENYSVTVANWQMSVSSFPLTNVWEIDHRSLCERERETLLPLQTSSRLCDYICGFPLIPGSGRYVG